MKHWLLLAALLPCRMALAQRQQAVFPPLLEASLQPVLSTTVVSNVAGVRYQYQLVHLNNDRIWLAPAWHGQAKLEPARRLFNPDAAGELDALLMNALNGVAAEGWELLEIRTATTPVEAVQKVERELRFNDPEQPVYKGTTSVQTSSETRYLFRRALPRP